MQNELYKKNSLQNKGHVDMQQKVNPKKTIPLGK